MEVEKILRESGAILEGHFLLTSGLHSPTYLEKFRVLQHPTYTARLCQMIAEHFQSHEVQVVAGPTVGGIILAYEVARQLGVRGIFAEPKAAQGEGEGEGRVFRGGLNPVPGERVLVVDDILTTGGSVSQVVQEVKRQGAKVVGIGVLVDRAGGQVDLGVPLFSCHQLSIPTYEPQQCPLCAAGIPLTKPGGQEVKKRPH